MVFSLFLILYRAFSQVRKPHVLPILQEENGPIMIPKTVLKSGLWHGLVVEIAIYNFDLFHCALLPMYCPSSSQVVSSIALIALLSITYGRLIFNDLLNVAKCT